MKAVHLAFLFGFPFLCGFLLHSWRIGVLVGATELSTYMIADNADEKR